MSTVLGLACAGGVVLAGDRLVVADGRVRSRSARHVFDFGSLGAAATGQPSAVSDFADRLDAEVRAYRTDRGDLRVDALASVASALAAETGVSALAAARNDDGVPRLRAVDSSGAVTDDPVAAFGSGAPVALGVAEAGHDPEATLAEAVTLAREAFASAAERDAGTCAEVDVYRLAV